MSDDGELAIVIIAMLGNPFSPWYAEARAAGPAPALAYSSMHVAVYGNRARTSAWALDEGPVSERQRDGRGVEIGESTIGWERDRLVVRLDERTTPAPSYNPFRRRVTGAITFHPEATPGLTVALDRSGQHLWWPLAPLGRIEVELTEPRIRFTGHGYHDANAGEVPLEATFTQWGWSRARLGEQAYLTYDVSTVDGGGRAHAFRVAADGGVSDVEHTWDAPLPRSRWQLERSARVDHGEPASVLRSLEDGPFYSRALIQTKIDGRSAVAVHETLAGHRLLRPWVQHCASYRMRRRP